MRVLPLAVVGEALADVRAKGHANEQRYALRDFAKGVFMALP